MTTAIELVEQHVLSANGLELASLKMYWVD